MAIKQIFSISNDFLNQKIDPRKLEREILESSITAEIDYINTNGDECEVVFKDTIFESDSTALNSLIANHDGEFVEKESFGSMSQDGSSDGQSSTTSTSYQQKLKVNAENLPAGKYVIFWSFEFSS